MPKIGSFDGWDSQSGEWLGAGDYRMTIIDVRGIRANTGTPGYEITAADDDTMEGASKTGFFFKPGNKGNVRVFVGFLRALGIADERIANFDTDNPEHFEALKGRKFMGRVTQNDRGYHEIDQWWAIGSEPPAPRAQRAQPARPAHPNSTQDDDIPF